MREIAICSPEDYSSRVMQEYIHLKCQEPDKQWIYDLISGKIGTQTANSMERIYLNEPAFMLCRDIHPGTDTRYLVIFKDTALKTIRDLTGNHLELLTQIQSRIQQFLRHSHPDTHREFKIFFHYTPSVFQLHVHVSVPNTFYNTTRVHHLSTCIRNLRHDSDWYAKALILVSLCRSVKALNLYVPIPISK